MTAGDNDLVAFLGEGQGRGAADPGECAGNQDNGHLALLASFGLKLSMQVVSCRTNPLGCALFPVAGVCVLYVSFWHFAETDTDAHPLERATIVRRVSSILKLLWANPAAPCKMAAAALANTLRLGR